MPKDVKRFRNSWLGIFHLFHFLFWIMSYCTPMNGQMHSFQFRQKEIGAECFPPFSISDFLGCFFLNCQWQSQRLLLWINVNHCWNIQTDGSNGLEGVLTVPMEITLPIANGLLHTPSQCGPPKTRDVTSSSPRNVWTVFKSQQGFFVPAIWRDIIYWLPNIAEPIAFRLDDYFLNMLMLVLDYQLKDIFFWSIFPLPRWNCFLYTVI